MTEYPKVSVVTITYGHENYITQTLDGVLMQDYPGEIEFIIANDCSPDKTDYVLKQYFETHYIPDNFEINYTRHSSNKGVVRNFIWALQRVTGQYISLCEGDDFWTDPLKLMKQVEFLEVNPDYVLCFTNRNILENGEITISADVRTQVSYNKTEIPRCYVPTLTVVFRNKVKEIPRKLHKSLIDCSLFLFLSQFGSFYYLRETTAVYRVHSAGLYSGNTDLYNFKRSTAARIKAWLYLDKIDRITLSHVIADWNKLLREAQIRDRKYLSAVASYGVESLFGLYVFQNNVLKKISKLTGRKSGKHQ